MRIRAPPRSAARRRWSTRPGTRPGPSPTRSSGCWSHVRSRGPCAARPACERSRAATSCSARPSRGAAPRSARGASRRIGGRCRTSTCWHASCSTATPRSAPPAWPTPTGVTRRAPRDSSRRPSCASKRRSPSTGGWPRRRTRAAGAAGRAPRAGWRACACTSASGRSATWPPAGPSGHARHGRDGVQAMLPHDAERLEAACPIEAETLGSVVGHEHVRGPESA